MKLLITGGNGQLGWELKRCADRQSLEVISCSKTELDITDINAIEKIIKQHRPTVLINTAVNRAVDKIESETLAAFKVNTEGAKNVAVVCHNFGIPLVHLSTNYVFNGQNNLPYLEEDTVDPINVYGKSKWQGEQAVREVCPQHVILRISGIFGVHGQNFLKTILKLAKEQEELNVVADQSICPTPAVDIAEVILKITNNFTEWGTFHYCSNEAITWHGFAEAIILEAKKYTLLKVKKVLAIKASEYSNSAVRPNYSELNCQKINKVLGIRNTSWRPGLSQVIKELLT